MGPARAGAVENVVGLIWNLGFGGKNLICIWKKAGILSVTPSPHPFLSRELGGGRHRADRPALKPKDWKFLAKMPTSFSAA